MTYPNVYATQTGPLALSSLDANFLYAVDIANGALSATAGGTADAITATYSPAPAALVAGLTLYLRAASANATTTPQFSPNGLTGKVIVKNNNQALAVGDIAGAGHWLQLVYDATNGVWELMNPATSASVVLTGGTANGVAYLNASKVLTTGTALTFDGTSLTSSGFSGPLNGTVGATTANTGSFTTLSASSTVSGTGFTTYLASPPAIGGTAAAAGSFTTLGASGSVTLSGGTANGVAYLNGSKVLTTGSALTFDGTNFATTGTATATKLIPTGTSVTGNGLYLPAANALGLSTNGINAVYIDASQNVGIGTASPSKQLTVANDASISGLTVGKGAGAVSTNTAVGASALAANTSGASGVAIGYQALQANTTASNNTAVGYQAGYANTTSTNNVLIGYQAGYSNTVSSFNTFVGQVAGYNTTGVQNTFIGSNSGNGVTTGTKNTIIGTYSGAAAPISATGSNYIVLSDGDGNVRQTIDPSGNAQFQAGAVMPYAPAPAAISAATTLTNANIQGQIISATGTTYTITMALGTTLETLATWSTTNIGYDFFVINTATGVITMAVNTGVTSLGSLTVAIGASAHFRLRRTAANTFVLYRLV